MIGQVPHGLEARRLAALPFDPPDPGESAYGRLTPMAGLSPVRPGRPKPAACAGRAIPSPARVLDEPLSPANRSAWAHRQSTTKRGVLSR